MQIPDEVEMKDIPAIIQYLWAASMSKMPVGSSTLDEAMEKHPEYFPEEVEYCRKMSMVPKQVHDAHMTELMALHDWWFSELPESKGLWYYCQHPEEYTDHWKASEELHSRYNKEEMERRIWNKHYTLWGLKKAAPTQEELQKKQDEEDARKAHQQQQDRLLDQLRGWIEDL
jgi:hypothetical protein